MLGGLFAQPSVSFDVETDIPDLTGKVIAITGGNAGLGKETVLRLASHNPSHIYILARNPLSANEAITSIRNLVGASCAPITPIKCDLADLDSVVAAAASLRTLTPRLDILFLNAGIMFPPPGLTAQGYEIQFGTNHMGHFLLTQLVLPLLRETASSSVPAGGADVRVVVLSSLGMYGTVLGWSWGGGISFEGLKRAGSSFVLASIYRYGVAKLANALFAREMQRRFGGEGIMCVAVHPGVITTGLWRHFFGPVSDWGIRWGGLWSWGKYIPVAGPRTVEEGVINQIWAAVGKRDERLRGGEFYVPVGVPGEGIGASYDDELAKRLWEWSAKEVEGYTP